MAPWPVTVLAGVVIGVLMGVFGVGGSSVTTPVLSLLGAPGLFAGLLANGGGFLLVPLYVLVFGLRMRQAVGTSLLVVAVLSVPTLATHWALGHVDWHVATLLAAGLLPGSLVGGRLAHRFDGPDVRRVFGWFLVAFGVLFTAYRL